MRAAAKILLIIGGLLTVISIIFMAMGVGTLVELGEDLQDANRFEFENVTSGTINITDFDGKGELGFTFWVKGSYGDSDGDGRHDICDGVEINVTKDSEKGTGFYFEVGEGNSDCEANSDGKKDWVTKGLAKVGRGCFGCVNGTAQFTSNTPVWVTYDDRILTDMGKEIEESAGGLLGLVGGVGGLCCGIVLVIAGLIMIVTLKDAVDTSQQYHVNASGMMVVNTDQAIPTMGTTVVQPPVVVQQDEPVLSAVENNPPQS